MEQPEFNNILDMIVKIFFEGDSLACYDYMMENKYRKFGEVIEELALMNTDVKGQS